MFAATLRNSRLKFKKMVWFSKNQNKTKKEKKTNHVSYLTYCALLTEINTAAALSVCLNFQFLEV